MIFKKRNKKQTSQCRLRIDKREKIISLLLLPSCNLDYINDKIYEEETFIDNKTVFSVEAPFSEERYFNWKNKILKETNWIGKEFKYDCDYDFLFKKYYGDKKIRIYKKWMLRGKKKDFTKVLKYLYTPFFLAVAYKEVGHKKDDQIILTFFKSKYQNIPLLKKWIKDIFDLNCSLVRKENAIDIVFDKINTNLYESLIKTLNTDR